MIMMILIMISEMMAKIVVSSVIVTMVATVPSKASVAVIWIAVVIKTHFNC